MTPYNDFLTFAHSLADVAREITLNYFRKPVTIEGKDDGTPVTIADRETEKKLRERIERHYPEHGITGEEDIAKIANGDFEWILDPIDGTRSFISGYPLFGTLICLLEKGQPVVSIIDMPAQNERFYATAESTTVYRRQQYEQTIKVSPCQCLSEAKLFSTDPNMFTSEEKAKARTLRESVNLVRYNGDCYLYAMLAAGWIDLVLEADLKAYDFLPLKLIVEQAGGVITDWQGRPLTKKSNGQVLAASNAVLHKQALVRLAQ